MLIIDEPKDFREDLDVFEGDADYSEIQKLWKKVPENYNLYTKESAAALLKVIESLSEIEDLDYDQQHLVDAKAKEFKEALDNLELKEREVLDLSWNAKKDHKGIEFSIDWPAENFVALFVDGKELVDKQDFTYKSGSTVINLLPEYLKTLKTGEYDIKVVFMYDKDFYGVLKVVNNDLEAKEEVKPETKPVEKPEPKSEEKSKIPPTGLNGSDIMYINTIIVSTLIFVGLRKKKYN